jgi:hypothetical protein
MNKKTLRFIIIAALLISAIAGTQSVKVAKANPFFIFHQISPIPGTIPPNITISSPQNNTVYSSDNITISFSLSFNFIIGVNYTLDNETVQAFSIWHGGSASNSNEIPEFSTTFTSPSLPTGNHKLTVAAEAVVYVGNMSIFFIDGSSTVFFTIDTSTPSPTPTETPNIITKPTMKTAGPETQFKLNIAYAYVGEGPSNASFTDNTGHQMSPVSQYLSAVILNITRIPNAQLASSDAEIEFYKVQITTDTGEVENHGYFVGSNNKPSLQSSELTSLTAAIGCPYGFIVLSDSSDTRGDFQFNWTQNTSIVFPQSIGSIGCYSGGPTGTGLWGAGTPNAISVAIYRIGYATTTNGSVSLYRDASNVSALATQQLSSYGNGFLYNTLIPSDKLNQTDLFHPIQYPSSSSSPSPNPSFSPSPTQTITPTPTPTVSTTFLRPIPSPSTTQQPSFSGAIFPSGYAYAVIVLSIITIIVSISLLYRQRTKNQKRMIG